MSRPLKAVSAPVKVLQTSNDAASTGEVSVDPLELLGKAKKDNRLTAPVVVPRENIGLWYVVESSQMNAHLDADVGLAYCFIELASAGFVWGDTVKSVLAAIKLMHMCRFDQQDICSVLAHACVYFSDTCASCGNKMSQLEKGHVLAALIYIAHTYVLDVTCPLQFWHEHLFRDYSSIKQLDQAVMRLLKLRKYILRVNEEDLSKRFVRLQQCVEGGVMLAL